MKRSDQPFVVGRKTARGTTIVVLRAPSQAPAPPMRGPAGPWTLRAVVGK